MIRLKTVKTCNTCKAQHLIVPSTARILDVRDSLDGYYWECECKSTLFAPMAKVEKVNDLAQSVVETLKKLSVACLCLALFAACNDSSSPVAFKAVPPSAPSIVNPNPVATPTPVPSPTPLPTPTPVQLTVFSVTETVRPQGVPINFTFTAVGSCTQYLGNTYCWDDGLKTVTYNPGSNQPIIVDTNNYWQDDVFNNSFGSCLNACANDPMTAPSIITLGVQNVLTAARISNVFNTGIQTPVTCGMTGNIIDCGSFQINLNQTPLN